MRRLALALLFVLAGCGGSAVPASHAAASDTSAALRAVDGSNRTFSAGRLWVSSSYSSVAFDLQGPSPTHPSLELTGIGNPSPPGGGTSVIADMTVAPDGTVYELVGMCATVAGCAEDAAYTWKLKMYARGASGAATKEQVIHGTGRGRSVALSYNGINVLASDGTAAAPHGYVTRYRYAAGDDAAPVRTLTLAYAPRYYGLDANGLMYIGSGSSVFVYPAASAGTATPVRTIHLPGVLDDAFALGPSQEIYVPIHDWTGQNPVTVIGVYGSSNNGPVPDRSITMNVPSSGIAVDANRTVYVGMGYFEPRAYSLKTGDTVLSYFVTPDLRPDDSPREAVRRLRSGDRTGAGDGIAVSAYRGL